MAKLYKNYPRGLSDKDLIKAIDEYTNEINASGVNINSVLRLSPYISLGLNELQSRQSRRVTRISLCISIMSIVIAALALFVSLESGRTSAALGARQTAILEELSKNTVKNQNTIAETAVPKKDISTKQSANSVRQQ